ANFADRAVGLMALPISRTPRDYIVFFRREVQQMVTWAGSPEKPVETGPNGIRLTPRKSFEAWKQVVTGRSDPWKPNERRVAESLRVTLLEVVLKLSDEANSMRKRAQDQQELLIAELNHRVRNILNLIQGLVSQGRGGAMTIDDYCTVLDARITALARAHDQLTRKDWGWVSLEKLIRTEATAFLQQKSNRILLDLEPVELSPNAFTAMALVIHELVTNSAKYGALSDQRGAVRLTGAFTSDGSYNLHWAEQDGPPVQMPSRKGFGMTIIERTIPFELKGTAQIDFHLTGVQTQFSIPTKFVRLSAPEVTPAEETRPMHPQTELKLSGSVLVVEDNMIIALDASDILSDLGASEVLVAATVAQAERYFQDNEIRFALLDVNLGSETSRSLAQHCIAQKIPYALATGYGGDPGLENEFPDAIIVSKPYGIDDIRTVLSELARNGALKS
ncbi:MAG: HWE histidine kinase domain-containing protein, partial [Mangrovicoccus sp.]